MKKTINLKINAAKNPKMNSLSHNNSELKRKNRNSSIRIKNSHIIFENRERAKHRLKLKIASFFMKTLVMINSVRIIVGKNVIVIPNA